MQATNSDSRQKRNGNTPAEQGQRRRFISVASAMAHRPIATALFPMERRRRGRLFGEPVLWVPTIRMRGGCTTCTATSWNYVPIGKGMIITRAARGETQKARQQAAGG